MSRRDFLQAAMVGAGGLVLASCGAPTSEPMETPEETLQFEGKELHLMTWSDPQGRAIVEHCGRPFEGETGAQVVEELLASGAEMAAKIKAARSNPWVDVSTQTESATLQLAREGLLTAPDITQIPNLAKVPSQFRLLGNGMGLPFVIWPGGIVYNTDIFPEPPCSYSVMWDPEYKGKVFINPPSWGYSPVIIGALVAGGTQYDIELGWEKAQALKDQVGYVVENPPTFAEMLRAGDLAVGYYPHGLLGEYLYKDEYPIGISMGCVEEGFFASPLTTVIVDGHPGDDEVIYAFMNKLLDAEVQSKIVVDSGGVPVNNETVLPDDLYERGIVPRPEEMDNAIVLNMEFYAQHQVELSERLVGLFGGG
ncbi:MAG: ABC transporter substrate-binding protein [bacterium]